MKRCRRLASALGLSAGLLAAPTARATPDGSDTNRWRAHLGGDLGSWVRQTPWPRVQEGPTGSRDYLGFIGFRRLNLNMGLGHGFRDHFVVGLRLGYEISRGVQRSLVPGAEARAITVDAMPYLTVMFDDQHVVRPYVTLRAGLGGGLLTVLDPSPLDRPERSSSLLLPGLGLDVGTHAFVSEDVSIDGMLSIDHRWEYLRGTTPASVPDDALQLRSEMGHVSFGRRFNTSIVLAVSRWF
jgi:hypothetical protein